MARKGGLCYYDPMKLSKRLQAIFDMVNPSVHVLWDTCCDHGQLGKAFLDNGIQVNFVDQVEHIIENLEKELKETSYLNWGCFVLDAGQIVLNNIPSESVVIAGVGGWTGIKTVQSILERNPVLYSEIIASVHKNQETFEAFMLEKGFKKLEARVVEDRGKRYNLGKYLQYKG